MAKAKAIYNSSYMYIYSYSPLFSGFYGGIKLNEESKMLRRYEKISSLFDCQLSDLSSNLQSFSCF